jgi:predicted TIM-barrel fold metal-dependent hydrolase
VVDPQARAVQLLTWHDAEARRLLPVGAEVFDAHLHLGTDIDGMIGDYEALEELMGHYGISRAFMFCLDEPDRHPAFRAANDRTLAFAERSKGRLIPFVRLDLNESPIEEAKRCLDLGARGIKLHPRAQAFTATDERLVPVFELSAERRVPILIHGGRGLPPIADGLLALVERFPEATLIIAHAGIADMGDLARCMSGRKGVVFDTSTWSPIDLLDFYRLVPPEQVVYASDYPYGQQPGSLLIALRTAQMAGFSEDQVRAMLAGTASRIADGEDLPEPTRPVGSETITQTMQLARIHQYLSMAMPMLWLRQPDTVGVLGLAINTCAERTSDHEAIDLIRPLLETARDLWTILVEIADEQAQIAMMRQAFRLIHIADIESVTATV